MNGDGTVDVADIATIISEMAARARRQEIEVSDQPQGDVNGDLVVDVADIASVISVMAAKARMASTED